MSDVFFAIVKWQSQLNTPNKLGGLNIFEKISFFLFDRGRRTIYNWFVTKTGFWESTKMSDNTKKNTEMERLEQLGGLVDQYAQSRVLPLLIPLAILSLNAILILYNKKLAKLASPIIFHPQISMCLYIAVKLGIVVWVILSSTFVGGKILARYGSCFYKKEGEIELEQKKIPIWAWAAYAVTFIGPAVLSELGTMSIRWALTVSLASFGIFMLYVCKKQKVKMLGVVFGGLSLTEAAATAIGVPFPFAGSGWTDTFFAALMIYIVSAGLITTFVVHIYNRKVLRKIKQTRPFGEQQTNKSDT